MGILIAHASIDERGRARGGQAGDQTKKEVCVRTWYDKPWPVVLRPVGKVGMGLRLALNMERATANDNIGYNQDRRNTLHKEAQKVKYDFSKINTKCDTDCSALVTACAIGAGAEALEYTGNAPTTSTMLSVYTKTGDFKRVTGDPHSPEWLRRGDVLVAPGSHTVVVLTDGKEQRRTVKLIVEEILEGLWGNGAERKRAITNAGYNYEEIQAEVNRYFQGLKNRIN